MKKLLIGMIALMLLVGVGTVVSAEQMMPSMMSTMMKKMHPNVTNEKIQEMQDTCKINEADMQQMMNHTMHHS